MKRAIVLSLILLLLPVAAHAKGQMQVRIAAQPDAPIQITRCSALSDDNYDYLIEPDLIFTNITSQVVVGIRFGLTFYSHDPIDGDVSLGPPLAFTWPRNNNATISPGKVGGYHDAIGNVRYPSSDFTECSVLAVKFADGRVWAMGMNAPSGQAESTGETPVPSPTFEPAPTPGP